MANREFKYFSGNTEVTNIQPLRNAHFAAIGGVKSKHNQWDSFSRMVGEIVGDFGSLPGRTLAVLPVTRKIAYKTKNPSLHKCSARCQNATGHNCECECGGANHGISA